MKKTINKQELQHIIRIIRDSRESQYDCCYFYFDEWESYSDEFGFTEEESRKLFGKALEISKTLASVFIGSDINDDEVISLGSDLRRDYVLLQIIEELIEGLEK